MVLNIVGFERRTRPRRQGQPITVSRPWLLGPIVEGAVAWPLTIPLTERIYVRHPLRLC